MGSIRIPSHFCGVYGYVPSEGAITVGELVGGSPMGSTTARMLRIGVQAKEPENIEYAMPILFDGNFPALPAVNKTKLKIAWSDSCGGLTLSKASRQCFRDFRAKLADHYELYELKDEDYDFNAARDCFLKLFYGVLSVNLPSSLRFVLHNIMGQKNMSGSLKGYLTAENTRERLIRQLDDLMSRYDCLIVPTSATPAFKHQKPDRMQGIQPIYNSFEIDGTKSSYAAANLGFTTPFLTGNPIITLPIGTTEEGLPVGVQLAGRRYHDYELFMIAQQLKV
jgi:amidase